MIRGRLCGMRRVRDRRFGRRRFIIDLSFLSPCSILDTRGRDGFGLGFYADCVFSFFGFDGRSFAHCIFFIPSVYTLLSVDWLWQRAFVMRQNPVLTMDDR